MRGNKHKILECLLVTRNTNAGDDTPDPQKIDACTVRAAHAAVWVSKSGIQNVRRVHTHVDVGALVPYAHSSDDARRQHSH